MCFVVVAVAAVVAAVVMVVVMLNHSSGGGGEHFYHPIMPRKPVHKLTFPNQSSPRAYLSQHSLDKNPQFESTSYISFFVQPKKIMEDGDGPPAAKRRGRGG